MRRMVLLTGFGATLVLVAWANAPADPRRAPQQLSSQETAGVDQAAQAIVPLTAQIDQQAAELRRRLAARAPLETPARNPFSFRSPAAPRVSAATRRAGADAPAAPVEPPAPPPIVLPTLVAIVADQDVRSAMLTLGDDSDLVKEGQTFVRFLVKSIRSDAVELVDLSSPDRKAVTLAIR